MHLLAPIGQSLFPGRMPLPDGVSRTGQLGQNLKLSNQSESNFFTVPRGQLSFDLEGIERPGSIFHSRMPHVPSSSSGVTIGRGFDLASKSPGMIRSFLGRAGFDSDYQQVAAGAAGLRGVAASNYLARSLLTEISPRQQWNLFNLTYELMEQDVRRISAKADTVERYGIVNWEQLFAELREVVVDLRYRGDYTPETRKLVQPYLAAGDAEGMSRVLADREYWIGIRGVPSERFEARIRYLAEKIRKPIE